MQQTEEQTKILESSARVKKVRSRAGTGKTTQARLTAERLMKTNPKAKILYLVFNKSQQRQAEKTFPKNTKAKTTHSFAFSVGGYEWKDHLGQVSPATFLEYYEESDDQYRLSAITNSFMVYFLNSPYTMLEAVDQFSPHLSGFRNTLFHDNIDRILEVCQEMMGLWEKKKVRCPHDFYLKLMHMRGWLQKRLERFDLLILDESQDLTLITVDLAKNFKKDILIVGDSFQQIYSWRYAINAMDEFDADETFGLTQSFRFGPTIADFAKRWVQEMSTPGFQIRGTPGLSGVVSLYERGILPHLTDNSAILNRTNVGMFGALLRLRSEGVAYRFERDLRGVLGQTLNVFNLMIGQYEKIRDDFLKEFESFEDFEDYSESMEEVNYLSLIKLVKTYFQIFPGVIFDILAETKKPKSIGEGVTLSTAHSSKGCEYDKVVIGIDMISRLQALSIDDHPDLGEEVNIAYVSFTRAKKELYVPNTVANIGPIGWYQYCHEFLGN